MAVIDIVVAEADFDVAVQYQALRDKASRAGAIVVFVGLVRDFYSGDHAARIEYIELQHYPGMTENLCREIIQNAGQRYPFEVARVVHRVGKIRASEQIVMVAVASQHRDNAFNAAQFIMDYLKTRATFWKKEVGDLGQQWLGLKSQDRDAVLRWNDTNSERENRTDEQ